MFMYVLWGYEWEERAENNVWIYVLDVRRWKRNKILENAVLHILYKKEVPFKEIQNVETESDSVLVFEEKNKTKIAICTKTNNKLIN